MASAARPTLARVAKGRFYRRRMIVLFVAIFAAMLTLAACLGIGLAVLLGSAHP